MGRWCCLDTNLKTAWATEIRYSFIPVCRQSWIMDLGQRGVYCVAIHYSLYFLHNNCVSQAVCLYCKNCMCEWVWASVNECVIKYVSVCEYNTSVVCVCCIDSYWSDSPSEHVSMRLCPAKRNASQNYCWGDCFHHSYPLSACQRIWWTTPNDTHIRTRSLSHSLCVPIFLFLSI